MDAIEVANREIGPGAPCFIAVEIGLNHNGDQELAHRLVDAAADAGVDAVKFQNYRTEDFIGDRSVTYEYISSGQTIVESQYDMFSRYELPDLAWPDLLQHCEQRGVVFFSTPTSEAGIDQLVRLGVPLLKNGSDYLVHLPVIRAMARTGIPTVLSTGMATPGEVKDAVQAFRDAGGTDLILLHCTSAYPTPADEVHLRKIPALEEMFECPVGLSDHTVGTVAALGAVALGACFLEKHFTLDKSLPGPDHCFSADPAEIRVLVESVRVLERSLGERSIGPTPSENLGRMSFRLSCVAARDLAAGSLLRETDVVFRRPGTGLPPAALESLVGRKLRRDVVAGALIQQGDLG